MMFLAGRFVEILLSSGPIRVLWKELRSRDQNQGPAKTRLIDDPIRTIRLLHRVWNWCKPPSVVIGPPPSRFRDNFATRSSPAVTLSSPRHLHGRCSLPVAALCCAATQYAIPPAFGRPPTIVTGRRLEKMRWGSIAAATTEVELHVEKVEIIMSVLSECSIQNAVILGHGDAFINPVYESSASNLGPFVLPRLTISVVATIPRDDHMM